MSNGCLKSCVCLIIGGDGVNCARKSGRGCQEEWSGGVGNHCDENCGQGNGMWGWVRVCGHGVGRVDETGVCGGYGKVFCRCCDRSVVGGVGNSCDGWGGLRGSGEGVGIGRGGVGRGHEGVGRVTGGSKESYESEG
jgi:hypothetical protein